MRPASFFAPVASILKAVAHRHGIETPLFEHRLRRRWSEIVGDQLAAHTRPDLIRFKKLYLIVENSVWLQQLTFLKPTLIEKINAAAGGPVVSDIVLRVGELARAPRALPEQVDDPALSVEDEIVGLVGLLEPRRHLTELRRQVLPPEGRRRIHM